MPDTFGFNAALHATRVTVHGGNHFPNWRFSLRDPRGVADEHGLFSPGKFISNVNTTTPGTTTAVLSPSNTWHAMLCTMCHPQYERMPACRLLNWCLHSRRINSRSVIPVNRYWDHCHRRSYISTVETARLVTLVISRTVTSRKPRGFALASGTSTRTLFRAAAPESVQRHHKAPSDPRRLGRQRYPTRLIPVTPKFTYDSGAFHDVCSSQRTLTPNWTTRAGYPQRHRTPSYHW